LPIHVKYESKFLRQKNKAHAKGQKKNAPLMSMSLLASLGSHCMKLDNLRVSFNTCIQSNPSQIHSTYYPFLQMFCKSGHAKESLGKRVSKGQHATSSMKSVKVVFEHCCCLAFFLKRFIFASWLQIRMELQKKSSAENIKKVGTSKFQTFKVYGMLLASSHVNNASGFTFFRRISSCSS
jgi:hypothetical protein